MKRPLIHWIPLVLAFGLSCTKQGPPAQNPTPAPGTPSAAGAPSPAPTQDLAAALSDLTSVTPGTSSPVTTVNAPVSEEPLEYVIEDLKGNVQIRETDTPQEEAAEEEEVVDEGDEVITGSASEASLTLDEETIVHIPQNSDVKVAELRPNPEKGFLSRLELIQGRVLSEVEKLGERHSSFEVESGGVVCGVRGTAFEVRNEGGTIHTSTFHGVVDMRKGDRVQAVVADHHSAFSPQKGGFLPPRPLDDQERGRYQGWLQKKSRVQQKQSRRLAVLRSLSRLSPAEKGRVLESLRGVRPKDRIRRMHQMLQHPSQAPGSRVERHRPGRGFQNPGLKRQGFPAERNQAHPLNKMRPKAGSRRGPQSPQGRPRVFPNKEKARGPVHSNPPSRSFKPSGRPPAAHFPQKPVNQPRRLAPATPRSPQMGRPLRPASGSAKASTDRQGRPGGGAKGNKNKPGGNKRKDREK